MSRTARNHSSPLKKRSDRLRRQNDIKSIQPNHNSFAMSLTSMLAHPNSEELLKIYKDYSCDLEIQLQNLEETYEKERRSFCQHIKKLRNILKKNSYYDLYLEEKERCEHYKSTLKLKERDCEMNCIAKESHKNTVKKLVNQIQESDSHLKAADFKIDRLEIRLKLNEDRLNSYSKDINSMIDHLKKELDFKDKTIQDMLMHNVSNVKRISLPFEFNRTTQFSEFFKHEIAIDELRTKATNVQKKFDEEKAKNTSLKQQVKSISYRKEKTIKFLKRKLANILENTLMSNNDTFDKRIIQQLKIENRNLVEERNEIKEKLDEVSQNYKSFFVESTACKDTIEDLKLYMNSAMSLYGQTFDNPEYTTYEHYDQHLNDPSDELIDTQVKLNEYNKSWFENHLQLGEMDSISEVKKEKYYKLKEKYHKLKEKYNELLSEHDLEIKNIQSERSTMNKKIKEISEENESLRSQLGDLTDKISEQKEDILYFQQALSQTNTAFKHERDLKDKRINDLTSQLSKLSSKFN